MNAINQLLQIVIVWVCYIICAPTLQAVCPVGEEVILTESRQMRSQSEVVAIPTEDQKVPKGTTLIAQKHVEPWCLVNYLGFNGYIESKYLTLGYGVKQAPSSAPTPTAPASDAVASGQKYQDSSVAPMGERLFRITTTIGQGETRHGYVDRNGNIYDKAVRRIGEPEANPRIAGVPKGASELMYFRHPDAKIVGKTIINSQQPLQAEIPEGMRMTEKTITKIVDGKVVIETGPAMVNANPSSRVINQGYSNQSYNPRDKITVEIRDADGKLEGRGSTYVPRYQYQSQSVPSVTVGSGF